MANLGVNLKVTGLTLVESEAKISKFILQAFAKEIDKVLKRLVRDKKKLLLPMQNVIRTALLAQPEVHALRPGGQLAKEFGLVDGGRRIQNIIEVAAQQVDLEVRTAKAVGRNIDSGFVLNVIEQNYPTLLGMPEAEFVTEKGTTLKWLEWLLKDGDKAAIVKDYSISFNPRKTKNSRTGEAVMIPIFGKRWRVPPQFAGTETDNFITRAIESVEPLLAELVEEQVGSLF